jgi:uncharacterized protein involved in exopolysaccharide biosynthesis
MARLHRGPSSPALPEQPIALTPTSERRAEHAAISDAGPHQRNGQPPRAGSGDFVIGAITSHKRLVALVGVILALAGAAVGIVREPTYTSSSTLQVGIVNLNSTGVYGFVQSASALATVFSRSITAAPVLAAVNSKLGIGPTQATQRLSAEPIPLSPSFRIIATGSSASAAVRLANTASSAVIAYEASAASATSPQSAGLLAQYAQAAAASQKAAAQVAHLTATHKPSPSTEAALIRARTNLDSARVRAGALGSIYRGALVSAGTNPSSGLVTVVAGAVTASSDRSSKIELLAFIGLLAGLVLGAVIAALYEQRRERLRSSA